MQHSLGSRFSYLINILALLCSIGIACYATMELSSRISAKAFVNAKLDEVRGNVSDASLSSENITQSNNSVIVSNTDYLRLKLSRLVTLEENLIALEFAGAQTTDRTIHSIQTSYERISTDAEHRDQISRIASVKEVQNAQLLNINTDISIVESYLNTINSSDRINIDAVKNNISPYYQDILIKELIEIPDEINKTQALSELMIILLADRSKASSSISLLEEESKRITSLVSNPVGVPIWASRIGPLYELSYLPSDILLAILMISCGALGSLFVGLRENAPSPLLRAPIGAAAGFISFLIVKGGKFLFLIQAINTDVSINPFASAFAGIIAGLFTEKAYRILEKLFDNVSKGVVNPSKRSPKDISEKADGSDLPSVSSGHPA